jgi:toxin CptA
VGTALEEYKYSGAVRVRLARSRIAGAFLLVAVMATLALIVVMPLHAAARILMGTWVVCCAIEALARIRGVRRVSLARSGEISVEIAGAWRDGVVRDGSFVAPWLTIVRWRPDGARFDRTILIVPDMAAREDLRALRVLLRWK